MVDKKEFYQETPHRELVKDYLAPAEAELRRFLAIDSVYDESSVSKDHPFGAGVEKALSHLAKLGEELGFEVDRCDNYLTELSCGAGKLLDIYAHADVVPVSPNWNHPPFSPTMEDGKIFARGATDDKGPGIAALYAAKALLDSGRIDGYRLRLIFGGDEERGSHCLHHYFHELKKDYPAYGFTPDADFPLIYAEKGIYTIRLSFALDREETGMPDFSFGAATNVVLDECRLRPLSDEKSLAEELERYRQQQPQITIRQDGHELVFCGKAVHGSTPWEGINAGLHLLNFMGQLKNNKRLRDIYKWFFKGDGKELGCDFKSDYFDSSSYCIGRLHYDGKTLVLDVNMRLPETVSAKEAMAKLAKVTGAEVELEGGSEALIVRPESPLVQTLLKVYREETGDLTSQPLAIGGGTYARESKNSVAFGPTFEGRDYHIHQDDEYIYLSDFENLIGIYAHAIEEVGKLLKDRS